MRVAWHKYPMHTCIFQLFFLRFFAVLGYFSFSKRGQLRFFTIPFCVWAALGLVSIPTPSFAFSLFSAPEQAADADPDWLRKYAPHWQKVMASEQAKPGISADGKGMNKFDATQWQRLIVRARQAGWAERLRLVNGFFNGWDNIDDATAWGTAEHWSAPEEFIRKRGGDCEDYAIAKYYALCFLGVPVESMRVIVLCTLAPDGTPDPRLHAVLAVRGPKTWFILDRNVRPRYSILPQDHYKGRFVPLFSMNEQGAWKHSPDPRKAHNKE